MSTEPGRQIVFGPLRFDLTTNQLWRGEQAVALQPKPLAVLGYLAERPGQVVTKQELLKAVWAGVYVTKAVVKECVRAIREALGEDATAPRYLETVGREEYRFRAEGSGEETSPATEEAETRLRWMVGRMPELARLQHWLTTAAGGARQIIFLTGEPGIGKTTVVDRFLTQVRANGDVRVGRGQCIEQHGQGEAYLPVLEALGQLCREPGGERVIAVLRQYAPTWLVQLPAVVAESERGALSAQVQGAARERMLREMAEALEALTAERTLVLALEDLQWSDQSTLELLSCLAQRWQPARLLMLGTYRPADLVLGKRPLKAVKQELQAHGQCEELRLELLSEQDVREYLARRFPQHRFPPELATVIHRRTDGNALFMVNVIDEMVDHAIVASDEGNGHWRLKEDLARLNVPTNVRYLIERQLERLSEEEQRVLEVASVAGAEFAVAAIATALKHDLDAIEDGCEGLAGQGHFLTERGVAEWPDGTMSGRYAFQHALYQHVLYDRIAEARRGRFHRLIGERLETSYGERAREVAAELAVHFERGRDYRRAIRYLQQAGENAIRRSAHVEAIGLLTKGLELLKTLPDTPERTQQELMLQITLGGSLMTTKGVAAPEVGEAYARARELCRQVEETPQLFSVLLGLASFYGMRAENQTAHELAEQCLSLAQSVQDPTSLMWAHAILGATLFFPGEFALAQDHLAQGIALYDPQKHNPFVSGAGQDPKGVCLSYAAWALWLLGYPDQALQSSQEALTLAQELSHPYSLACAMNTVARLHQFRRERQAAQERAEALVAFSSNRGFPAGLAPGMVYWG